jgi:hypothetical protein
MSGPLDDEDDKAPAYGSTMPSDTEPSVDMDDEDAFPSGTGEVTDTPDGGAIVAFGKDDEISPDDVVEHFANLAEEIDESELSGIASELLEKIEEDKEARKRRDDQYKEGIQRTGLGDDAPGGADFEGASKVTHPLLTEACVDFAARAMKELYPASGPVKDTIIGTATKQKVDKAQRKTKWMNFQITKKIKEFRSEFEVLLTQVPLGGAQFLKMWQDQRLKRPRARFVPIDDILIPYAATSYRSADRRTEVQRHTELEFQREIDAGVWRDINLVAGSGFLEPTGSQVANDKIEGREETGLDTDGVRTVYEICCSLELDVDGGELRPYRVSIDGQSTKVLAIYRNWLPHDEEFEELLDIVEFPFVPWRGGFAIGLPHMIGGLSGAATGALRALLDSAHINNFPTALKLQGGSSGGQSLELSPTEIKEFEGGIGQDDIRKVIMPVPFNQPSPVLFQLLGFLVEAGRGVVQTTFEKVADQRTDMPVGTTLALIEQGQTVFSSIHARLHNSMEQVLGVLHRLNSLYLNDGDVYDDTGEVMVRRSDFQGPMDVVPVSDPNIFSETQRFAQVQAVAQRAANNPLYDQRKVEELILARLKLPDAKDLLVPRAEPQHLNAVNENVAAVMGRPIVVFPEQDHLSHLMTHAGFMMHPLYGQNPLISPKMMPVLMPHLAEHLAFLYVTSVFDLSSEAAGMDVSGLIDTKDPDVVKKFDEVMLGASNMALSQLAQNDNLKQLMQIIQSGVQYLQSLQQPPPMDPSQVAAQDVQRKTAADQQAAQAAQQKGQMDQQRLQIEQQKAQLDQQKLQIEISREQREAQAAAAEGAAGSAESAAKQQAAAQKAQLDRAKAEADFRAAQADVALAEKERASREQIAAQQRQAEMERAKLQSDTQMAINTADNQTAMAISAAEMESGEKVAMTDGAGINPTPGRQ